MNPLNPALSFDSTSRTRAAWCDGVIEVLVGALLALMPFALGVVAPWSEAVVAGAVALVAVGLAVRSWLLRRQGGLEARLCWALVPVGLFLAVAAGQLVPLPASVVGVLSPHTLETRRRLLHDLPNAAALLARTPLSFYPAATRHDLRLVLGCTVLFLATIVVYRREEQQRRLLWVIALSGGAAAVLALLQDLSGAEKIYWRIDTPRGVANSGPFVAYSNYSQYINLCIGAALGLLLYALRRESVNSTDRWSDRRQSRSGASSRRRSRDTRDAPGDSAGESSGATKSSWRAEGLKSWRAALLVAVVIVGCVTLFLSLSRGGMLSLLCAGGITWLMLARRRRMGKAGWLLTLVLLVAFVAMLYAGAEVVFARLATLKTARDPSAGRFQTYKDILLAWRQYPLFGTGLGTHEYVYSMFDRSSDPGLSEYADSDYFQTLEEMGAVGLALVLAFAAFLVGWYLKVVRRGGSRMGVIAYGLGFGLAAVLLQSFTDFGQHLPSIGCISAVFCGMLFNLAAAAPRRQRAGRTSSRSRAAETESAPAGSDADGDASAGPLGGTEPASPPHDGVPVGTPTGVPALARLGWRLAGNPFARLAVPAALAIAAGWAFLGADAGRRAQALAERAAAQSDYLETLGWRVADAELDKLLGAAAGAVAEEPGNVKLRYQLACYEWRVATRPTSDDATDEDAAAPSRTDAKGDAQPGAQADAKESIAAGDAEATAEATSDAGETDEEQPVRQGGERARAARAPAPMTASVEWSKRVIEELNRARAVCPTFGPTFAVAGQIERMVLGLPVGTEHVRTAYALAPANPEVCLVAAQLALAEGRTDESLAKARRSLALDPESLPQVMDLYLHTTDRPDLAVAAVGDSPERLCRLYEQLREAAEAAADGGKAAGGQPPPAVAAALASARDLLKSACRRPEAEGWTLASLGGILMQEKDYAGAIDCYRRALQKDYGQADWHMGLADALALSGQTAEAAHQAEIVLHLQPQMKSARSLLQDMHMFRNRSGSAGAAAPVDEAVPSPGDPWPDGEPGEQGDAN